MGLPVSIRYGQAYDNILTIICHVTKYVLFLPYREDLTMVDLAEMFFEYIKCRFGTPRGVVSDRDSRIISDFWREVYDHKIIKRRISTAYHP